MAPKQRMRIANEKATKNITLRGNVPKSSVSYFFYFLKQKLFFVLNSWLSYFALKIDKFYLIIQYLNCFFV